MFKKILIVMVILILLMLVFHKAEAESYTFGNYWQTFDVEGAKTPVEWLIIDESDDAYLLISKYSLDASVFNLNDKYTTWENSIVREFLNGYFYDECFSAEEKERIRLTLVEPHINTDHPKINQGNPTWDNVFLLSAAEADKYFNNNNERIAIATGFAQLGHAREFGKYWQGAYTVPETRATCWRLRTMGWDNYHACVVLEDGFIALHGDILYSPHYAVRPCIWVLK